MTIETNLERIATALEGILAAHTDRAGGLPIADLTGDLAYASAMTGEQVVPKPAKVTKVLDATPSYAEKRKAEVKEEVKAAEPEKKPRGRPVGSTKPKVETPPVVEPVVEAEEDPFADSPVIEEVETEEEVTLEDLRKVLVEMRTKIGKDKAYAVLRDAGKGASYLPGSTAAGPPGGPGELKPENYAAVVKAARKAMA